MPDMKAAQKLYAALGVEAIPPYVFNPVQGTQFLQRTLRES